MAIVLLLYFIGLLIFLVIGLVSVFHAFKYKMPGDSAIKGAYAFIAVSLLIVAVSFIFILRADWSIKPNIFGSKKTSIIKETK